MCVCFCPWCAGDTESGVGQDLDLLAEEGGDEVAEAGHPLRKWCTQKEKLC